MKNMLNKVLARTDERVSVYPFEINEYNVENTKMQKRDKMKVMLLPLAVLSIPVAVIYLSALHLSALV